MKWIRQATFRKPEGEIERLLTAIHETSSKKRKELEKLWELEPTVNIKDAPSSKIGNAVQEIAESQGTKEIALPYMERT